MLSTPGPRLDTAPGDLTGRRFPAHPAALLADGADGLTRLFRAAGTIGADDAVAQIVAARPCPGGSTGAKLFLTIRWRHPAAALDTELFVKFSRDFADPRRDLQRDEMRSEVRLAALSRNPAFPLRTPKVYFADYHAASGTGLLVTERIRFGEDGIEPHRRKCRDHLTLADPLPHYRAIVAALADLAGAHRAGRLGNDVERWFSFDPATASSDPIRYDEAGLRAELSRCAAFAERCPRLLPAAIRDRAFLDRLAADALYIREAEPQLRRFLTGNPDLIALCHWNAHIDNSGFWQTAGGGLDCGLLDWGRVGQLTLGAVLWGALSAAHPAIWSDHLGELLDLFVERYRASGGPAVTREALALHLDVHMATMGVARVLMFPATILSCLPDAPAMIDRLDPRLDAVDPAHNMLHIYAVLLTRWQERDFGAVVRRLRA